MANRTDSFLNFIFENDFAAYRTVMIRYAVKIIYAKFASQIHVQIIGIIPRGIIFYNKIAGDGSYYYPVKDINHMSA